MVDSEKVVGIATLGDLQRVPAERMGNAALAKVMTKSPLVVYQDETLLDAMDKMVDHRVGRLPVVTRDSGKLVGMSRCPTSSTPTTG